MNLAKRDKIRGEKKGEKETKNEHYHRKETWEGKLERRFSLPASVDQAKIEATLADGVLSITLTKSKASEAKKIPITS